MSIVEAEHPAGVPVSVSVEIGGKEITFETGKLAKQADGAVVVRSGDTVVLGTAQGRTEAREGADFFPLTVDVEERMYAAGKIPGGFFKREGRPTERAILTARMTDRPVRPLWPKGYRNEVQCVATVFSADLVTAHDILCINARLGGADHLAAAVPRPDRRRADGRSSTASSSSTRRSQEAEDADLDLIVVGTKDGLTMVEAGANQVPEEQAPRGARDRAARDREALRGAGGAPREGGQAEVARPGDDRAARGAVRPRDLDAHPASRASARPPRSSRRSSSKEVGPLSMTVDAGERLEASCRCACRSRRSSRSSAPSPSRRSVREQFENDLQGLTDAEQDSKELKSAKRSLLFERIIETVKLPFPVGPATSTASRSSRTR